MPALALILILPENFWGRNLLRCPRLGPYRRRFPDPSVASAVNNWSDAVGLAGVSQANTAVAASAPRNCMQTNPGTSARRMPENVLVKERAIVTAGLANEVDAVNQ